MGNTYTIQNTRSTTTAEFGTFLLEREFVMEQCPFNNECKGIVPKETHFSVVKFLSKVPKYPVCDQ